MRALSNAGVLGLCLVLAPVAVAQTPPATDDASDASPSSSPNATAEPAPVVDVTDPMLEPVEPPAQVLSTWRQALALVRGRSTTVATAQARVMEANARSREALAQNLPSLSGSGSVRRSLLFGRGPNFTPATGLQADQRLPFPPTVWNAGVSFRQPLFDLRGWHNASTADLAEQSAATNSENAERLALGAVADTIVTVITAERLAEVSRVSLRSNLSTLDLTRRRARLGAASAVDVLRAEQEVTSNRLDVVQADESVRRSREALGMALGYSEAWGVSSDVDVTSLANDARSVCTAIATADQRSDVRAARLSLEVSQRNVEAAGLGYSPTLDLVSDLSYTTQPQVVRPVQWSVGAVLSVPIFDGGLLAAQRRSNLANRQVAEQQLTEATRRAELEAVQARRAIEVAQANFEVSSQARDIAREAARLSRIAFVHGTGTSFDLVESARRQRLSEIDVTIREFEVVRANITALLALSNCDI